MFIKLNSFGTFCVTSSERHTQQLCEKYTFQFNKKSNVSYRQQVYF